MTVSLTIIWGSLILAFVGGVRRGFGVGTPEISLRGELWTMALYVSLGGAALVLGWEGLAAQPVALQAIADALVALRDHRAAKAGNAPAHFATLRPLQMPIATAALLAILARLPIT